MIITVLLFIVTLVHENIVNENISAGAWATPDDAAMAAAQRYTGMANSMGREVGVTIVFNPKTGLFSYGQRVHVGDDAVTIDTNDPGDVPSGFQYVGTWHAHSFPEFDGLDGHIATIKQHPSIAIWTSYEGYVVKQYWDSTLNHGRGGDLTPFTEAL